MEVMGLMLGEYVDDYTVRVIDVFAMPQSGTGVSVEAVDPVFQTKMLDMLKQTGRCARPPRRPPARWRRDSIHMLRSLGCWVQRPGPKWSSGGTTRTPALAAGCRASISTRSRRGAKPGPRGVQARPLLTPSKLCALACPPQSFEALHPRAVAVVIDPIQSVKGKVVIDAFRLINPQTAMMGQEPRQTTSNIGHLNKPSIQVREPGRARRRKDPCGLTSHGTCRPSLSAAARR